MSVIGFPVILIERPQTENPVGHLAVVGHNVEQRPTSERCPICENFLTLVVVNRGQAGRSCAMSQDGETVCLDLVPPNIEPIICKSCGTDFYRLKEIVNENAISPSAGYPAE